MSYDIFISYRRKDCAGLISGTNIARTIKQQLEIEGYKNRVFFDYSELSDDDFENIILKAIAVCKVFILVLTRDSMMRCVNEDDWVRREILHAQKCGLKIIPIEPDNHFNGYPEKFPAELNIVKRIQHTTIHLDSSFERDMQAMINARIKPVLTEGGAESVRGALVKIDSDLECRVLDFGEDIGIVGKGINEIRLPKGNHELVFVGVESDAEHFDYGELDVRDLEYVSRIKVRLFDQYNARKSEEKRQEEKRHEEERINQMLGDGKGRNGVYKVGDYYDDGKMQGVVFEVSADGKHGKIVCLRETHCELQWTSDAYEQIRLIGTNDKYNGANNMAKVKQLADWQEMYPAFAWCASLGDGWYLPAIEELKKLFVDDVIREVVNSTLKIKGMAYNSDFDWDFPSYWSSTEKFHLFSERAVNGVCVWCVHMSRKGGSTGNDIPKCAGLYVRAVAAF